MCLGIAILIELWPNQDQKSTLVAIDLKTIATLESSSSHCVKGILGRLIKI